MNTNDSENPSGGNAVFQGIIIIALLISSLAMMSQGNFSPREMFFLSAILTVVCLVGKKTDTLYKELFIPMTFLTVLCGSSTLLMQYGWETPINGAILNSVVLASFGLYIYKTEGPKTLKGFVCIIIGIITISKLFGIFE